MIGEQIPRRCGAGAFIPDLRIVRAGAVDIAAQHIAGRVIFCGQLVAIIEEPRHPAGPRHLPQPPLRIIAERGAVRAADQPVLGIIAISSGAIADQIAIGVIAEAGGAGAGVLVEPVDAVSPVDIVMAPKRIGIAVDRLAGDLAGGIVGEARRLVVTGAAKRIPIGGKPLDTVISEPGRRAPATGRIPSNQGRCLTGRVVGRVEKWRRAVEIGAIEPVQTIAVVIDELLA